MSDVDLRILDGVATLTLTAADRRNSLTVAMAQDLIDACEQIDGDVAVGAVVVHGSGGYFCAGAHRDALAGAGVEPASPAAFSQMGAIYESFARVGRLAPPTIAAIVGGAVGAGVNLAYATDLRIVADDAKLLAGFLRIGLHPGGGHFALSGRLAGREATMAASVFGEPISGLRAVELGIAWEALPSEQVLARAQEVAARAGADPELARRTIRSARQELGPPAVPWDVALDAERGSQMWSLRRRHERASDA
ncbi:enoyl-CoA hydratase-related protein [Paraconexibacter antarcticus]|uniref:Enoyl-CoA hydratase-related protein n=1 Tax=Paraconexibacter antarcticus TaxID=2949664 RepID=A0ABY5E049_9ACTN|nr:enoyl-CoA hydratase-related protein [Paraconexibacter antarcticus]UTI66210.1 enoyl-CoA hydratase-related protein [Paraconexibacter antarcticus]